MSETTAIIIDDVKVAETTHDDIAAEPFEKIPLDGAKKVRTRKAAPKKQAVEEKPAEKVVPTECANGHPRAEFWTTTAGGRKYCRACAVEASQRSRAKNPRPTKRQKLSDDALTAIEKVASYKNTKAEVADELRNFVSSCRG